MTSILIEFITHAEFWFFAASALLILAFAGITPLHREPVLLAGVLAADLVAMAVTAAVAPAVLWLLFLDITPVLTLALVVGGFLALYAGFDRARAVLRRRRAA